MESLSLVIIIILVYIFTLSFLRLQERWSDLKNWGRDGNDYSIGIIDDEQS